MPHKHKKNQNLSDEQQAYNKWISRVRVKIEHIIASVKIFSRSSKDPTTVENKGKNS
jgi:hypothetical protein